MGRKVIILLILLAAIMVISCKTIPDPVKPEPATQPEKESQPVVTYPAPVIETFNPLEISSEYHSSTRAEVQQFIENLNQIIRRKNYTAWKAALSPEFFAEISSPQNLSTLSESPAMTTRKIVLRSPQDYFEHVVVPSRANLHVDDIEFVSMTRVKAFSITRNRAGEEVRLRLYDLEKINNTWTIIN